MNNIELTVWEAQEYLRHGDTRNLEDFDEDDFREMIVINDYLLETLESVREKVLRCFPRQETQV
jgi:hypothetical protein